MKNKNYRKGYNFERRIVLKARDAKAQLSQRSAGSHSPVDVFVIKNNVLYLIQCKSTQANMSNELEKFKRWAETIPKTLEVRTLFIRPDTARCLKFE